MQLSTITYAVSSDYHSSNQIIIFHRFSLNLWFQIHIFNSYSNSMQCNSPHVQVTYSGITWMIKWLNRTQSMRGLWKTNTNSKSWNYYLMVWHSYESLWNIVITMIEYILSKINGMAVSHKITSCEEELFTLSSMRRGLTSHFKSSISFTGVTDIEFH